MNIETKIKNDIISHVVLRWAFNGYNGTEYDLLKDVVAEYRTILRKFYINDQINSLSDQSWIKLFKLPLRSAINEKIQEDYYLIKREHPDLNSENLKNEAIQVLHDYYNSETKKSRSSDHTWVEFSPTSSMLNPGVICKYCHCVIDDILYHPYCNNSVSNKDCVVVQPNLFDFREAIIATDPQHYYNGDDLDSWINQEYLKPITEWAIRPEIVNAYVALKKKNR